MLEDSKKEESSTSGLSPEQEALLKKSLAVSEEVLEKVTSIKKYIKLQQVWATLRLLIILVPIIIGLLYLPNFLERYFDNMF